MAWMQENGKIKLKMTFYLKSDKTFSSWIHTTHPSTTPTFTPLLSQVPTNNAGLRGDFGVVLGMVLVLIMWPKKTFYFIHNYYKRNGCKLMNTFFLSITNFLDQNLPICSAWENVLGVSTQWSTTFIEMNGSPHLSCFCLATVEAQYFLSLWCVIPRNTEIFLVMISFRKFTGYSGSFHFSAILLLLCRYNCSTDRRPKKEEWTELRQTNINWKQRQTWEQEEEGGRKNKRCRAHWQCTCSWNGWQICGRRASCAVCTCTFVCSSKWGKEMSRDGTKGVKWNNQMKKKRSRWKEWKSGEREREGEKFNKIEKQSERREVQTPYGIASGEEGYDAQGRSGSALILSSGWPL